MNWSMVGRCAGILLTLAVAGCGGQSAAKETPAAGGPETGAHGDSPSITIDESMMKAITVAPAAVHAVPQVLRATGKVQFDEGRIARILAPVAGEVTGLTLKVGDRVQQGAVLFSLNSRDAATAVEDHLDAHRDLDLAEQNLAMTKDLFDHQAASKFALEQAQNDVAKARTRVDRTEAALAAIGITAPEDSSKPIDAKVPVTSPIAGAVLERHLSDGQYVQPDPTPLVTIADLSEVWIEADVFERDLHMVHAGESADVLTAAYPNESFRAEVARVGDVLDPVSRTVKVRFVVSNPGGRLKPEMFATIRLVVDSTEQAITVPAAAIITEGDATFAYVQVGDRAFARRPVEVAPDGRDSRRVLRGLSPGDRVVVAGALLLRAQEHRIAG